MTGGSRSSWWRSTPTGAADHDELPMASLRTPAAGPRHPASGCGSLAEQADRAERCPSSPASTSLLRRTPRTRRAAAGLPHTGNATADLIATLLDLDRSYLAVQGPPGTGKTYLGSHVIAELVSEHGWKVGVVAQSHAVVENMLDGLIEEGGLDPDWSASWTTSPAERWAVLRRQEVRRYPRSATERAESGLRVRRHRVEPHRTRSSTREPGPAGHRRGRSVLAGSTLGVSVSAQRLLLLGDPQQLPQVSQGTHGEPVNESALSWVIDGTPDDARDRGLLPGDQLPDAPSRLRPGLAALLQRRAARSARRVGQRSLDGVEPGSRVVRLAHVGNSVSSPEEADEVVRQVRALIGTPWTDPERPGGRGR